MNTYDELKGIYDRKRAHKLDRAIPGERNCRVDSPRAGVYRVRLHGNVIITAYPDYMELSDAGWNTPTTRARIWSIGNVNVYNDSRCGFIDTQRIYDHPRGKGLPFFNGIRVDYNGRIFDEDVRSDFRRRVDRKIQQQYTRLHKGVWKKLAARVALGEFVDMEPKISVAAERIFRLERMGEAKYPAWEDVEYFTIRRNWNDPTAEFTADVWKTQINAMRGEYYRSYDGYYNEEIKNV